ncbi:MAG: hypothetical protein IIA87_03830 [Nanoarchaeota archaeon]|nr:hypothetical protein [Nanoarchaeota archaeon]
MSGRIDRESGLMVTRREGEGVYIISKGLPPVYIKAQRKLLKGSNDSHSIEYSHVIVGNRRTHMIVREELVPKNIRDILCVDSPVSEELYAEIERAAKKSPREAASR